MHNSLPAVPKWRFFLWRLKFRVLTSNNNFNLFTANINTKESLRPLVSKSFFNKITVIYANINPQEIERSKIVGQESDEIYRKYGLPANKFLVFCVGQFIDRKGRWIFLEAARQLLKENDEFAFVWISNSKPSSTDLEKAKSYNLGENFLFITSDQIGTAHIDLFKLLRQADVFALPSFLEGLPISILEAMALGIPTVSTNINAIPEAIKHLETGLLIEPGNPDELKEAILLLKNDLVLREKLSIQGKKYVLENFDEAVVAKIAVERYINSLQK
jgi:glycosyltransferase involved in cell wall biosynthesis